MASNGQQQENFSGNLKPLTLESHRNYKINNNCSEVKVDSNCTVSCDNNCGKIELGPNTVVTSSNNNCGHIVIGENSTLTKAKRNCGSITIGANSIVKNVNGNFGKIDIGGQSVVPEIIGNFGQIKVGPNCDAATSRSKTNFGQIMIAEGVVVPSATSVQSPTAPAPEDGFQFGKGNQNVNGVPATVATGDEEYPDLGTFSGKSTCSICMERGRNIAFLCGHTCCSTCAEGMVLCHMCRVPIERKIRLYD